jgi:uncharacterized protein YydD (DUF2326 family)
MLHEVFSPDLETFKAVRFHKGLNLILAERTEDSGDRQTRNGAGKSSLVEIINFLFGAKCDKSSLFRVPEIEPYAFGMVFDIADAPATVLRSGSTPGKVTLTPGSALGLASTPLGGDDDGAIVLSLGTWKQELGSRLFGLVPSEKPYGPTFRMLAAYFARRAADGGFKRPRQAAESQQLWQRQVALSILLGLDWTLSRDFQVIREKQKAVNRLRKEFQAGHLGEILPTPAEIRTRLLIAQDRAAKLRRELESFRVHPEYQELEKEASALTGSIADLANANTADEERLLILRQALDSEAAPGVSELHRVYEEAGLVFGEHIKRRLSEAEIFHHAVTANRAAHLESDIQETEARLQRRHSQMADLDSRRSDILRVLDSHGALDQHTKLHGELVQRETDVEELKQKHSLTRSIAGDESDLQLERTRLQRQLQQDLDESRELRRAILKFANISGALSTHEGYLFVEATDDGPSFEVHVPGERSIGIMSMQIFAFDMLVMCMTSARNQGPGFLIHDSHLFDAMDERQVAKALDLGARFSEELGFQYIVAMNTDQVPLADLPEGFDLDSYAVSTQLNDHEETGGLFGFRFG